MVTARHQHWEVLASFFWNENAISSSRKTGSKIADRIWIYPAYYTDKQKVRSNFLGSDLPDDPLVVSIDHKTIMAAQMISWTFLLCDKTLELSVVSSTAVIWMSRHDHDKRNLFFFVNTPLLNRCGRLALILKAEVNLELRFLTANKWNCRWNCRLERGLLVEELCILRSQHELTYNLLQRPIKTLFLFLKLFQHRTNFRVHNANDPSGQKRQSFAR